MWWSPHMASYNIPHQIRARRLNTETGIRAHLLFLKWWDVASRKWLLAADAQSWSESSWRITSKEFPPLQRRRLIFWEKGYSWDGWVWEEWWKLQPLGIFPASPEQVAITSWVFLYNAVFDRVTSPTVLAKIWRLVGSKKIQNFFACRCISFQNMYDML